MCELVENYARKYAEEYAKEYAKEKEILKAKEIAKNLFENSTSYELVRASIDCLLDEELKEIYEQVRKAS